MILKIPSLAVSPSGNVMLEVNNHKDLLKSRTSSPDVSMSTDSQTETLKLEDEINQVLQALRVSQDAEYELAEELLFAQKKTFTSIWTKRDALLSAVLSRVDQIKREMRKLEDMEEVANGFGRTCKDILKEHFGLEVGG
ncbi:hypothetical protein NC653_021414 [Populus alba x Populus x berolinensis]|uniref:DUF7615 domain-containing protein n=1 Tax=Populus alba x Populus x berolinensis TaxID=444605 RepID=A0AAD6MN77_9ROSI|nr:hypothetical protein NC653_021414 [Populus alba x Populus x berolinensis]